MGYSKKKWEPLARKRLVNVIRRHTVAGLRTLEQKISDAGPYDQRIDPHILGDVRWTLLREGVIEKINRGGTSWFWLPETSGEAVIERLGEQLEIHEKLQNGGNTRLRIGQTLEIAIYRALCEQSTLTHFGGFRDLESHDDSTLYSKEEPPSLLNGRQLSNRRKLDFLVQHPTAGLAGIEAKNIREWIYPGHKHTRALIEKALELDCVPVFIVRRYQYALFSVLYQCGVLLHQNFNQLLPEADHALAEQAKHKRLLGYHDIRTGNKPDKRLVKFITVTLPHKLPEARERFDKNKDLLEQFVEEFIDLEELTALLRQRDVAHNP